MHFRFAFFIAAILITQSATAQLFGDQQIISTSAFEAAFVYSADLDGDGDMDVLSATNDYDKIAWYENQGGGLFGYQQIISTQVDLPISVYTADLDGDGDLDVLSASAEDGKIAWYENQGAGIFGDQLIISIQNDSPWSVHAADLDDDGDMDVLSASSLDDKIAWYENQGGGTFGDQQIISTEANAAWSVYSADMDGDGDIDVLSASGIDNKIAWYENQGGGTFGDQQIISIEAEGASSVRTSDLDGDGDFDVLSSSMSDNKVAWYENQGAGTFGGQQIISTQAEGARSVDSADLDGDGDMDVLSASQSESKIAWYENQGGGAFGDQQIITTEVLSARAVYTADLDGDGDMDVLSASHWDDKIAWYENVIGEGCTDSNACNYEPDMWIEDGSCCFSDCGCTTPGAVNFAPTATCDNGSCRFQVIGTVFFDENENGLLDESEYRLPFQEVGLFPNNLALTTNDQGNFFVNTSGGSDEFTFQVEENPLFPFFTTPQTLTFDATQENWNQDTLFFGVSNELPSFDLEANMYSVINGFPCNDERGYYLCFRNTSNVSIDVQLEFQYDSLFQSIIESSNIDSIGENIAYLSFNDVAPYELVCTEVELLSPTVEFIGEYLETSFEVQAFYDGEEVAFGIDSLSEELTCAYDPNDKQVFPEGYSEEHYIANDTLLEYLVRFQNTGNAPATDVVVRDTLDENLNLSSFQLVANSHPVYTTVDPATREVEFYFQNIMLPDSVNNEPESHGFVSFTVRPESELPLLTELNNTAAIYFDNNPPIITNTTWSTIYDCSLFDVSFTDDGALLTASEGDHYQWFLDGEPIEDATEQEYTALENGDYSVQVDIDFPCSDNSGSTFIVTSIEEWEESKITLFPNPMTTSAMLDLGDLNGPIQLEIYDVMGKLQRSEFINLDSGNLTIDRGDLSRGTYILRLTSENETRELKFVVE
ncbi:FG-GAP-like repeat-containing protein [Halocola ammonii]